MADIGLSTWQERLREADKALDATVGKISRLERWKTSREWFMNVYPDDQVSVNLVFAIGRALVPQLYFKTPYMIVQPLQSGHEQQAKILEAVDQLLIDCMGLKWQFKLAILDTFLTNLAPFKIGYHSVGTEIPQQAQTNDSFMNEAAEMVEEMLGLESAEKFEEEEKAILEYSYHDFIKPNYPWTLLVQPEDFLIPKGCKNIYEAPWCAFRVKRPLDDVKADTVYTKSVVDLLTPNYYSKGSGLKSPKDTEQRTSGVKKDDADLLEFFEVWDKRTGRVMAMTLDSSGFMRNDEHGLDIKGLPVEILQFNQTSWDFWGTSDVDQIYQQVTEYNENRTLELKLKRRASKTIVDQAMFDEDQIANLKSPHESIVTAKGTPGAGGVFQYQPVTGRDAYNMGDIIRDDVREILGWSRNQGGDFEVSRRTATEAAIVQQQIQLRGDERRDQVADLLTSLFQRKINPIIFDQWTEERVIEVTSMGGFVNYTGPQIRGDYYLKCIADSTLPLSKMQRQQVAQQMFSMFRGDPRIEQNTLYKFVMDQFDGVVPEQMLLTPEQYQALMQQIAASQVTEATRKTPGGGETKVKRNGEA